MRQRRATARVNRSPIRWRLLAVVLVALGGSLTWPLPWLEIEHGAATRAVYPGFDGTEFALRWTHSVELEDWIEQYRVVDSTVEISATRFKTFGAGVPAHAGRHTTLDDGWVVMSGIDRDVAPLTVQAAAAENYRFRYEHGGWQRLSHGHRAPILVFHVIDAPLASVIPDLIATTWRGVRS